VRLPRPIGDTPEVVGWSVGPDELLSRLRISERQLVEIAKALAVNARVKILTSLLVEELKGAEDL